MGRMREIGEALEGDERYLLQCRPDERVMTRDGVGLVVRRIDPGAAFVSVLQGEEASTGFDRRIHLSRMTVVVPWRASKVKKNANIGSTDDTVRGGSSVGPAAGKKAAEVNESSRTGRTRSTALGFQGILDMIEGKRQDSCASEKVEREGAAACLELVRVGGMTHAEVAAEVRKGKWGDKGWGHDAKWLGNLVFHARKRGLL